MTLFRIKLFTIAAFAVPFLLLTVFRTTPAVALSPVEDDVAAVYKKQCAMCHGQKAEKAYDPEMPRDEQIQAVLKGKQAAKPPHMPAFEPKGMKHDEAAALVDYMLAFRKPAN